MTDTRRPASHMRDILRSTSGFSLVEMVLVMAIFMSIIIISSGAFNKLVSVSTQEAKSVESDTQGVIGLEMLRVDLEHAGYGLPWELSFPAEFQETVADGDVAPGVDPRNFNDLNNASSDTNRVPRALQSGVSSNGSDYLVLKSTLITTSETSKKWAYVDGVGGASQLKSWGSNNLSDGEKIITLDSRTKRLISKPVTPPAVMTAADFSYAIAATNGATMMPPDGFQPPTESATYLVYGVSSATTLRAPYNRIDFYVKQPDSAKEMPARCAPGTGILYKGVLNHTNGASTDGKFTEYPLLECVADMQVVFHMDTNGDGGADAFFPHNGLSSLSAKEIRQQVKAVNIYVVTHEGRKDGNFAYSKGKDLVVGEGFGRTLDLETLFSGTTDSYLRYRWKTYKISVLPKNLNY